MPQEHHLQRQNYNIKEAVMFYHAHNGSVPGSKVNRNKKILKTFEIYITRLSVFLILLSD